MDFALYNENGTLIYNGSFSEGKYNGKGTSYYKNGKIRYEGNYKNDIEMDLEFHIMKMEH